MVWKKFLLDFLLGGFFIAFVLAIVKVLGPFLAGIIAALPIRLGITLFLGGIESTSFAVEMIKGALPASLGALGFVIILSKSPSKIGLWRSFILACLVCLVIVYMGYLVIK